jgi:hypothetical protein
MILGDLTMKKYKLLKGFPFTGYYNRLKELPAGTIITSIDDLCYYVSIHENGDSFHYSLESRIVENSPDWFEEVLDEDAEITVKMRLSDWNRMVKK